MASFMGLVNFNIRIVAKESMYLLDLNFARDVWYFQRITDPVCVFLIFLFV